jgi:hypothetical protein
MQYAAMRHLFEIAHTLPYCWLHGFDPKLHVESIVF